MKIRGERKCTECDTRWSYYDTGEITCPDCGSVHSVGVEDRKLHTAGSASLDLTAVRQSFGEQPLADVADETKRRCREYVRTQGFVHGGDLEVLSDTYLAANELVYAMDAYARSLSPGAVDRTGDDDERLYILSLLGETDADGRPDPESVPESMHGARGLAYASAVDEYRSDVTRWLDERDRDEPEVRTALGQLADHVRRVEALDGDVSPSTAERLVVVAREIGRYLREDDETALATARDRLTRLADGPL